MSEADPWEDLEPISIQADGEDRLYLIGLDVSEKGGNRIARRARPFQNGAKLDSTGAKEDEFPITLIFHNDIGEPDVDNGVPMWPNVLEALLAQFKTGKTLTLNLPWKRGLRVKAGEDWDRRATSGEHRGGEIFTCTLIADNEDNLDREAIVVPSVKASLNQKVEAAIFDAESMGVYHFSMADIRALSADLVGIINQPTEFAQNIRTTAMQLSAACQDVLDAIEGQPQDTSEALGGQSSSSGATAEGGAIVDPTAAIMVRARLLDIQDTAGKASYETGTQQRRTRLSYVRSDTTIQRFARDEGQDPNELSELNDNIEDHDDIRKGTLLRVYAD